MRGPLDTMPGGEDNDRFDPYCVWLGIPPDEQPPHHYRLLGLPIFEDDRETIRAAVLRQAQQLRKHQLGKRLADSQRLLNEVSVAKVCLLSPPKKAAYDAALRAKLAAAQPAATAGEAEPPPAAAATTVQEAPATQILVPWEAVADPCPPDRWLAKRKRVARGRLRAVVLAPIRWLDGWLQWMAGRGNTTLHDALRILVVLALVVVLVVEWVHHTPPSGIGAPKDPATASSRSGEMNVGKGHTESEMRDTKR